MHDYDGRISRQNLKKKLKAEAKLKNIPKKATGKARRCLNCGNWIQKRELFYGGKSMGKTYIHVNTDPRVIDNINHAAIPRPIPKV